MVNTVQLVGAAAALASVSNALITGVKPYEQTAIDMFNVLKHQGGQGPWSTHTGYGIERNPPEQCTVDQVQLFVRHGERYPDVRTAGFIGNFTEQFKNLTAKNELYWLNDYEFSALDPANYELESTEGFYNGYSDMFAAGTEFRVRYGHLYKENTTLPIFTSSQQRIVVTALNVARGFFGPDWNKNVEFVVLNETKASGLNSLTNDVTCPAFNGSYNEDYPAKWAEQGLERALLRLRKNLPGVKATGNDIANLMALCMYDLNIKGTSPWCDYFTADDWVAYEYYHDLDYFYYSGPGNPTVPAIGGVVANASVTLLESPASPDNGTALYMSFMHEVNILQVLTGFGIVTPKENLTYTHMPFTNRWKTSQLVPMGARVAIERLSCANATDPSLSEEFVRFVVNDAVIPHDTCTSGPGFSCPLDEFVEISRQRIPDPIAACGINETYPYQKDLTFYWDWQSRLNTTYKNWVVDTSEY